MTDFKEQPVPRVLKELLDPRGMKESRERAVLLVLRVIRANKEMLALQAL
jgi:hypothetical protein